MLGACWFTSAIKLLQGCGWVASSSRKLASSSGVAWFAPRAVDQTDSRLPGCQPRLPLH